MFCVQVLFRDAKAHERDGALLFAHAVRVLTGDDAGAARRLTAALDGAAADVDLSGMTERERDVIAKNTKKPASAYHAPECLVDLYVGHGRASFVDLSAGPFAWGPLVGGEGLRNVRDLPDVDLRFGGLDVQILEALFGAIAGDEVALHTELETMRREHVTHDVDPKDAGATLRAEMDVYSMFATKHCKDRESGTGVRLCEDLKRRTKELETALKDLAEGGIEPVVTDFSIFGDDDAATNASLAHDLFVSELGSVVSEWYSHAVAPVSASGYRRYHQRVSVLVYMLSASPGSSGASGTWGGASGGALHGPGLGGSGFDVDGFTAELDGLMLPEQKLTVTTQRLSVADDPALAAAFLAATRSGTSPALDTADGKVAKRRVHWLDSAEVAAQLNAVDRRRRNTRGSHEHDAGTRSLTLEVPVFVLEADVSADDPEHPTPLLIDGTHVAVSLPDMVLVAQSAPRAWDSPFGCDGGDARWNLRDPLDAALAAVAEHIGGALPSHVGYNHARGTAEPRWLWSVGNNPFSATARGSRLATSHKDWVHRSYALTAVDASAAAVNAGVRALNRASPCAEGWESIRRWDAPAHPSALVHTHAAVAESWKAVADAVGSLDFAEAARLGVELERRADDFLRLANATASALTPLTCTRRRSVPAVHWAMLVLVVGVAAAVLWPAHDAYSLVNAQGYTAAKNMGAVSAGVMARTGTKAESAASRQAAAASAVHETAASSATLFSWIFFFTFQMTGVFGNLISSLLMTYSQGIENNMYLLYLVYYFIALGGVLLGALLRTPKRVVAAADPLAEAGGAATVEETPLPSLEGRGAEGIAECLTAGAPVFARALVSPFTLFNPRRRMRAVRLLCCVPMMLYAGCETAYFVSHFTSTFIQPVLGARSIGFIMMAFALGSALSSISVGVLQVRPSFLWCAFLLLLLIYSFACSLRSRSAPCRACSATRCFSGSGSSATSRCFPFSSSPATNWSTRRRRSAPCGSSSFSARFSGARVTPRSTRSLPSGSGARTGWWTSRRRSLSSARSCRCVCSSILCATSYSFVYPLFFSCFLFTHRFVSLHDYTMSCCRPSPRTSACGSASAPPSPFSSIRSSPGLRQ